MVEALAVGPVRGPRSVCLCQPPPGGQPGHLLLRCQHGPWPRGCTVAVRQPIDHLEVEAAAVVDALFGPLLAERGYTEEISFVDYNVSLAWITGGPARADFDPMISGLWLQMAVRGGFKWCERRG